MSVLVEILGWVGHAVTSLLDALFSWSDDLRARGYGDDEDDDSEDANHQDVDAGEDEPKA